MTEMWEDIAKSKPKLEEELKRVGNQSRNTAETNRSRVTGEHKDSDSGKGATLLVRAIKRPRTSWRRER